MHSFYLKYLLILNGANMSTLLVQYAGFSKRDDARELSGIVHNVLAHATHILSGGTVPQDLQYSVYILQNFEGCLTCLGSAERYSFHVVALIKCNNCCYYPTIHDRLKGAVFDYLSCCRVTQVCGEVVRLVTPNALEEARHLWLAHITTPFPGSYADMLK